jgi:membrane-associated protease RseP (regulator of RpoE activity)
MSEPVFPAKVFEPSPQPHQVHIVYPLRRRYWLHLVLFAATMFTTLAVGSRLEYNFLRGATQFSSDDDFLPISWAIRQPSRLLLGLPFSAALLCILLAHEMGHFVYATRNRVYATLPFFLPAPTLIGTFGAFIRIRSPIPTRTVLMDIGIAGPIAGFALVVPVLFLALILSRPYGHPSALPMSLPLLFHFVWSMIGPHGGIGLGQMNLHPTAFAAWVGLLATSLNLLPGGQLDGGHIVYAIAPRLHSRATRLCSLILLPMGLFLWGGWLLWGVVLLLPVMRHPPVPQFPDMDPKRKLLGVVALLMFVLSFVPVPLGENAPWTAIKPWIARHFRATH